MKPHLKHTAHAGHTHHGEIVTVRAAEGHPEYASVTIAHGARKKPKTGKAHLPSNFYDERPTSSIMIHPADAKHYHVGQRVHIGITPQQDGDGQDGEDATDQQNDPSSTVRSMKRRLFSRPKPKDDEEEEEGEE